MDVASYEAGKWQNDKILPDVELALLSGNVVGHSNKVTHRRARLVLRWVTIRAYAVSARNQPIRPTRSPTLRGTGNEYRLCGREGNRRSGVALATRPMLCDRPISRGLIDTRKAGEHRVYTSLTSMALILLYFIVLRGGSAVGRWTCDWQVAV